jgi:hypothetical protein
MTIFEDALAKAGFDRLRFELKAVADRFTEDEWLAIHRERMAEKGQPNSVRQDQARHADLRHPMPSEGQTTSVQQDHLPAAPARQSIPDEGHRRRVHQDQHQAADIRNPTPGEGHSGHVQQDQRTLAPAGQPIASGKGHVRHAQQGHAPPAHPAREPSAADIEALKESGDFHYFQMINLRKKAWSTYRYSQLKNVRSLNMQENMVINEVIDWGRKNKVKEDDLVSLTMPASEMKKIIHGAKNAIPSKAEVISKPAKRSAGRGR